MRLMNLEYRAGRSAKAAQLHNVEEKKDEGKINEGEQPYGNQLDYDECLSCQ